MDTVKNVFCCCCKMAHILIIKKKTIIITHSVIPLSICLFKVFLGGTSYGFLIYVVFSIYANYIYSNYDITQTKWVNTRFLMVMARFTGTERVTIKKLCSRRLK